MIQICKGRPQSWHPSFQPLSSVWINFLPCVELSILCCGGGLFLKMFTLNIIMFSLPPSLGFWFSFFSGHLAFAVLLNIINTKQLIVSTFSCACNGSCQQSACQQQTLKRHLIHWSKSRVLSIITKQDNAANRYPCYRRWCCMQLLSNR